MLHFKDFNLGKWTPQESKYKLTYELKDIFKQ